MSEALESHRDSVAKYTALQDRLRQSSALRVTEEKEKDKAMKNLLPHEKLRLLREERAKLRWQETQRCVRVRFPASRSRLSATSSALPGCFIAPGRGHLMAMCLCLVQHVERLPPSHRKEARPLGEGACSSRRRPVPVSPSTSRRSLHARVVWRS
jgi:hypothetical protein